MSGPEVLRVTDETSRAFLADLIAETNRKAKRQQRIVERFTTDKPSAWSELHQDLDALLTDYLSALS